MVGHEVDIEQVSGFRCPYVQKKKTAALLKFSKRKT